MRQLHTDHTLYDYVLALVLLCFGFFCGDHYGKRATLRTGSNRLGSERSMWEYIREQQGVSAGHGLLGPHFGASASTVEAASAAARET
jgi:hypothetical protein